MQRQVLPQVPGKQFWVLFWVFAGLQLLGYQGLVRFRVPGDSLLSLPKQLPMPNMRRRIYAEEWPICLRLLNIELRFLPTINRQLKCQVQSLLGWLLLQQRIQHLQQDLVQSCQLWGLSELVCLRDLLERLENRHISHLLSHLQHRWLLQLLVSFHLRRLPQGL